MSATSSLPSTSQRAASSSAKFQVLYVFHKGRDGIVPAGSLLAVNGTLYGTTNFGGDPSKQCYPAAACGTVYEFKPPSKHTVLYRFHGAKDGTRPYSGLINVGGTLYGTTQSGGKRNEGTVFAVTTSGSEHVIFSFGGKTGSDPRANLTSVNGVLYGTAYNGGATGNGTVFSLTSSGTEKVLHSFAAGGTDGSMPLGALIEVNNVLYGTTSTGGTNDDGTVFAIDPDGSKYSVLYSFQGGSDGAFPFSGLTEMSGTLYGTTQQGGQRNEGTVFAITTLGSESVLHSFGNGADGSEPFAGLTVFKGQLYGATAYGGSTKSESGVNPAHRRKPSTEGTIYTITPSGSEQVVHNFTGGPGGRVPYADLTAMNGALYGTTIWGGNNGKRGGTGTLFQLVP
ncbi:MAG: choice-of-anchor tandem repeat GloVer-containing protein [Candidatus Cybelea sp.]